MCGAMLLLSTLAADAAGDVSRYKVHYAVYQHGVAQDDPAVVEQSQLEWIVQQVPEEAENFLGFTDSAGTILQFFIGPAGQIWVEVPVLEKKGSYGKLIDRDEYRRIIDSLREPFGAYIETLELKYLKW